jgi:hypothetical protein
MTSLLLAGLACVSAAAPLPDLDRKAAQAVWDEVRVPLLRGEKDPAPVFDQRFAESWLKDYAADNKDSPLRQAVRKVRATLWAVAVDPTDCPANIAADVARQREQNPLDLSVLKNGLRVPQNEAQFRTQILAQQKNVAAILGRLEDARDELKKVAVHRDKETKRWQAHYDYVSAWLDLDVAFLYEYLSALGMIRKDLPPFDPAMHGGWMLVAQPRLTGDAEGKKAAKNAAKLLENVQKDYAGTPWEVLARRARGLELGLDWKAVKRPGGEAP